MVLGSFWIGGTFVDKRLYKVRGPYIKNMIDYPTLKLIENDAEKMLHQLSKTVSGGSKPHPGPYAFFNHSAQALERLKDCDRIVKRLFHEREKLTQLGYSEKSLYPEDWPPGKPFPDEVQKLMKEKGELTEYMKQDMETLYIFGGMLFDQWALLVFYIAGVSQPGEKYQHPFHHLVTEFEKEDKSRIRPVNRIYPIWTNFKSGMLWLDYQIRFYRNRFIVHSDRPWQRGTTTSVYGDYFNLFIPTPPGWLDDKKIDTEINKLLHLAPSHIREAPDDHWEKARPRALIERIFNNIGNIENKEDRKKVATLFGKVGGSTPSFQIIAENLFRFICSATKQLNDIAKTNFKTINIGRSKESGKEP